MQPGTAAAKTGNRVSRKGSREEEPDDERVSKGAEHADDRDVDAQDVVHVAGHVLKHICN